MCSKKIQKLDEILSPHIKKSFKIIQIKISDLISPGENYGSQMYRVDVKIESEDEDIEELHLVAKQIPDSEFYQKVFNVQVTFNQEKEFYKTILPTFHEFQIKMGSKIIDNFPKFFGARNNLYNRDNDKVDKNGLIIVENLKMKGYINVDRHMGFDLDTSKKILKVLAEFHAVALALKIKKPEIFKEKIRPYLGSFLPQSEKIVIESEVNELVKLFKESEKCRNLVEVLKISLEHFGNFPEKFREPFSTVVHRDFWVNNIMINFEIEEIKIIDFQMYSYDTPASDLLFFLFTSVETDILKENLDKLIKFYHDNFIQTLFQHNCRIEEFSYHKFLEEIVACAKYEFGKIIFMLSMIVRGPNHSHIDPDDPSFIPSLNTTHLRVEDKKRIFWIAREFYERGWLQF